MGQGNKKKFGRAKGYGPGSSIGSKVGKALGGHLSKAGIAGKKGGGSKNLSFKGLRKVLSNFLSSPANAMGDITGQLSIKNKQPSQATINRFLKKNIDITNMNKSFRIGIDVNSALNKIKNEKVKGWLKKNLPQTLKDFNINHQMYSPTKLKAGDPNYTPQGTGSGQLDPDTEKYLEWIATANPDGKTVSDFEKLYANQLAEGISLEQAMASNPANTMSFYALIDDKDTQNTTSSVANLLSTTTNNNKMALTQTQVNKLYNDLLGRDAVFGTGSDFDADYWLSGHTYDQAQQGIQGGSEFKNRQNLVSSGITDEATLDKMVLPGGIKTEHHSDFATGGMNADGNPDVLHFNKDNTWGGGITGGYAPELNSIMQSLGITAQNPGTNVGATGGSMITDGSDTVTGGGGNDTVDGGDGGTGGGGSWLDDYADMDAFKEALGLNQSSGGIDDFMKFMMFMSMMRPGGGGMFGGGGYGGSQYGYGGLNPGGVVSSYNPLENITSAIEAFKTLPGIGTGTINTGTNAGFTGNGNNT